MQTESQIEELPEKIRLSKLKSPSIQIEFFQNFWANRWQKKRYSNFLFLKSWNLGQSQMDQIRNWNGQRLREGTKINVEITVEITAEITW